MSQPTIYLYKNINVDNIVVQQKIRPDKKVSFRIYIKNGEDLTPLLIQTPEMICPFGLNNNSRFVPDGDATKYKWSMNLSFKGIEESNKLKVFKQKMKEIEDKIASDFLEKGYADKFMPMKSGKAHTMESIIEGYGSFIKTSEKYPSNVSVKIPWNYDSISDTIPLGNPREDVNFYDENRTVMNFKDVVKFSKVVAVININRIYISSSKRDWGIPVDMAQAQVKRPVSITNKLSSFQIIKDADSDDGSAVEGGDEDSVVSDVYTDGSADVPADAEISEAEEEEAEVN